MTRRRANDPAQDWVAEHRPEALADFPAEDAGRHHRELHFHDDEVLGAFMEGTGNPDRGGPTKDGVGARRQRLGVFLEATADHADELKAREAELEKAIAANPCSHCGAEVATRPRTVRRARVYRDLGEVCFVRLDRTGRLST